MIVREADSLEEKLFHFSIHSSKEDKKLFSLVFFIYLPPLKGDADDEENAENQNVKAYLAKHVIKADTTMPVMFLHGMQHSAHKYVQLL